MSNYYVNADKLKEAIQKLESIEGNYSNASNKVNQSYRQISQQSGGRVSSVKSEIIRGGGIYDKQMDNVTVIKNCLRDILNETANMDAQAKREFESAKYDSKKANIGELQEKRTIVTDAKEASELLNDFNDWYEKQPEKVKALLKLIYKDKIEDILKGTILEDVKDAYDIVSDLSEVWKDIDNGDYNKALLKVIDTGEDFYESIAGDKSKAVNLETGKINFTAMKIKAVFIALKEVMDEEGYIQKNDNKYNEIIEQEILDLNIVTGVEALMGSVVQEVGKGVTDVLCQTASSAVDGVVSELTGGLTLTSINKMMYEEVGTSPGHIFNHITAGISDGVDFWVDDVCLNFTRQIDSGLKSVCSTAIHSVKSVFA